MSSTIKKEPLEYGEITGYKCGELFVSQRGIFYLNCHFCDKTFFQLNFFATHFLEEHNFNIQESTVEYKHDDDGQDKYDEQIYIEERLVDEDDDDEDDDDAELMDNYNHHEEYNENDNIDCDEDTNDMKGIVELEEDIIVTEELDTFEENDINGNISVLKESVADKENQYGKVKKVEVKYISNVLTDQSSVDCIEKFNSNDITSTEKLPKGKEKCKLCEKVFTVAGMRVHLTRHLELFKCNAIDCKKRFQHQEDLNQHIINEHRSNLAYPFHCTACPRSFRLKIRLQQHFRRFHMREKNFKCSFCGKCFFLKNELKNHETFHTGIKSHVCEQCGKTFAVRQRLINHLKSVHPTGQFFKCEHCEKKFYHPDVLKRHQQCHVEGKPFKCDLCSKTFKRKHSLKSHIDVVHMHLIKKNLDKDRNFFCDICGRGFIQKRNLSFHKKSH